MACTRREGEAAPMTLGQALAAEVRLIVWCNSGRHQAEPDIAEHVALYIQSTNFRSRRALLCRGLDDFGDRREQCCVGLRNSYRD
jgi:hypothetical protein